MSGLGELAGLMVLAVTVPGSLYLAALTLAAAWPARTPGNESLRGRMAFVVPAHNEAAGIEATLTSLAEECARDGDAEIVVIADNCEDDTAALAHLRGARVLERNNLDERGKGYALDYAFSQLLPTGFAGFVIVDADTSVQAGLLDQIRRHLGGGADAVQARYGVRNAEGALSTQLAELALAAFNVLRPRGRDRLGLSVGILGNGFALKHDTLVRVPYRAASVVEDLEYHLRLIEAGCHVVFADGAEVKGDMPEGRRGQQIQRSRWEGGRLRMLMEHARPLTGRVLRGHGRSLEPLLELCLLPLGHHVLLMSLGAGLLALGGAPANAAIALLAGIGIVAAHVLVAIAVGHLPWRRLLTLAQVPAYLVRKLQMVLITFKHTRRDVDWVRTARDGS